jgi:hypothetical protein
MDSSGMIYQFLEDRYGHSEVVWEREYTYSDRQQGDLITLILFFLHKESRIKIILNLVGFDLFTTVIMKSAAFRI